MPEQNVELINMYTGFLLLNSCKVNRRGERLYLMCQWRSKMPNRIALTRISSTCESTTRNLVRKVFKPRSVLILVLGKGTGL